MDQKRLDANGFFKEGNYKCALDHYKLSFTNLIRIKTILKYGETRKHSLKRKIREVFHLKTLRELALLSLNCSTTCLKLFDLYDALKYALYCKEMVLEILSYELKAEINEYRKSEEQKKEKEPLLKPESDPDVVSKKQVNDNEKMIDNCSIIDYIMTSDNFQKRTSNLKTFKLFSLVLNKLCMIFLKLGNLKEYNANLNILKHLSSSFDNIAISVELSKMIKLLKNRDLNNFLNNLVAEHDELDLNNKEEIKKYLINFLKISAKEKEIREFERSKTEKVKENRAESAYDDTNEMKQDKSKKNTLKRDIKVLSLKPNTRRFTTDQHSFTYNLLAPHFILSVLNLIYKMFVHSLNIKRIVENVESEEIVFEDEQKTESENNKEIEPENNKQPEPKKKDLTNYFNRTPEEIVKIARKILEKGHSIVNEESEKGKSENIANDEDYSRNLINPYKKVDSFSSNSPIKLYFFGDTHGNLINTFFIIKQLTNNFDERFSDKLIFNGDFIDRGEMSVELVIFLFLLKIYYDDQMISFDKEEFEKEILFNEKYFLRNLERICFNRGNHEFKNYKYSFFRELSNKYVFNGELLFKIFNEVFSMLNLGLLINDVFVCHGGLPKESFLLDEVEKINRKVEVIRNFKEEKQEDVKKEEILKEEIFKDLEDSDDKKNKETNKSDIIEEDNKIDFNQLNTYSLYQQNTRRLNNILSGLLWSDPFEIQDHEKSRRGIGIHFGRNITNSFIKKNNLSLIIRSHEFNEECFKMNHNVVLTVFSAVDYDGGTNKGAYIEMRGREYMVRRFR